MLNHFESVSIHLKYRLGEKKMACFAFVGHVCMQDESEVLRKKEQDKEHLTVGLFPVQNEI